MKGQPKPKTSAKIRPMIEHIMGTFEAIERRETKEHGSFVTKDAILRISDEMSDCIDKKRPYVSPIIPCDPRHEHAPKSGEVGLRLQNVVVLGGTEEVWCIFDLANYYGPREPLSTWKLGDPRFVVSVTVMCRPMPRFIGEGTAETIEAARSWVHPGCRKEPASPGVHPEVWSRKLGGK